MVEYRDWSRIVTDTRVHACNCIGPRDGQPLCPCRMLGLRVEGGRYVEIIDHGPAEAPRLPMAPWRDPMKEMG